MKTDKFCLLLIIFLIFSGWSCQRKGEVPEVVTTSRIEGSGEGIESETLSHEPFVYDSQGKRDPFVSLERSEEGLKLTGFSLEGILWNSERPLAIINDQIVTRGDVVQGAEVVDIKEDRVILRYGKEESVLRLK